MAFHHYALNPGVEVGGRDHSLSCAAAPSRPASAFPNQKMAGVFQAFANQIKVCNEKVLDLLSFLNMTRVSRWSVNWQNSTHWSLAAPSSSCHTSSSSTLASSIGRTPQTADFASRYSHHSTVLTWTTILTGQATAIRMSTGTAESNPIPSSSASHL